MRFLLSLLEKFKRMTVIALSGTFHNGFNGGVSAQTTNVKDD